MNLLSSFLFTTGILATLLILVILFRTYKKELSQKLLFVVFVLLFFVCLYAYGELHDILLIKQVSFLFADSVGYVLGPLLYLYIQSIYREEKTLLADNWTHFIPLLLYLLGASIPMWLSAWGFFSSYMDWLDSHIYLLQIQGIYLIAYCLLSLYTLGKYQELLKQNFANLQEKDLAWIRYLLIGIILTILLNLVLVVTELYVGDFNWETSVLTTAALVGLILYLGYYGSYQSRILIPAHLFQQTSSTPAKELAATNPHHLSNASEAEIKALKTRLVRVLGEDKAYLEEDLSLGSLADKMEISDKKLSALLNQVEKISFYDLINQYRVEEVKEKMADPAFSNYTLLALAFDSGFKSKTSFNRIFKKLTGDSPSAYRRKLVASA